MAHLASLRADWGTQDGQGGTFDDQRGIPHHPASAAGEVAWWRATVEIDRLLRLNRSGRVAARVASQAAATVATAAVAAGLDRADPRVMSVARAAADVARGLAAQSSAVDDLLAGCRHLVAA